MTGKRRTLLIGALLLSYPGLLVSPVAAISASGPELTFEAAYTIASFEQTGDSVSAPKPGLSLSTAGNLTVSWWEVRPDGFHAIIAEGSDPTRLWWHIDVTAGGAALPFGTDFDTPPLSVATDEGGMAVFWSGSYYTNTPVVYALRQGDTTPFGKPANVTNLIGPFDAAVVEGSRILIVGRTAQGIQSAFLDTSTGSVSLGPQVAVAPYRITHIDLAFANSSTAAVCWSGIRNDGVGSENENVYASVSLDGGLTYGTTLRVDDAGLDNSRQAKPSCAFTRSGTLVAAWEDSRSGVPEETDLYLGVASTGFGSFGGSIRVDDYRTEIARQSEVQIVAGLADDDVLVFFHDARDFQERTFYAWVNASTGAVGSNSPLKIATPPSMGLRAGWLSSGALVVVWSGANASILLAGTKTVGAPVNTAPTCSLDFPSQVRADAGITSGVGRISDPDPYDAVEMIFAALDASEQLGLMAFAGGFAFSVTPTNLSEGPHTITVSVRDINGAEGSCSSLFDVLTAATANGEPWIRIVSPVAGETIQTSLMAKGEFGDPDGDALSVSGWIDGQTARIVIVTGDQWAFERPVTDLAHGVHELTVIVMDARGFIGIASVRFLVVQFTPNNPPECKILFPEEGDALPRTFKVMGVASDPDGPEDILFVEFVGPNVPRGELSPKPFFEFDVVLPETAHGTSLSIRVVDLAWAHTYCNVSVGVRAFFEPSVKIPSISITSPEVEAVTAGEVNATGIASAGTDGPVRRVIVVLDNGTTVEARGTTDWQASLDFTARESGLSEIWAIAFGPSLASNPAHVRFLVGSPPEVPLLLFIASTSVHPQPAFLGSTATIEVRIGNIGHADAEGLVLAVSVTYLNSSEGYSIPTSVIFSSPVEPIPANGSVVFNISWYPEHVGIVEVHAVIDPEEKLDPGSILDQESTIRVLVVRNAPAQTPPGPGLQLWLGLLVTLAGVGIIVAWGHSRLRKRTE